MMTKNRTSTFFNAYAPDFDAIYGTQNTFLNKLINRYLRKSMRVRFLRTIEGCNPIIGKTVIDIGCGPGHYGITLAKGGAQFVLGIDFADAMIDLAALNSERAGVKDRCNFIQSDFMTYDIRDKFDYSIVMGFMDYIQEPKRIIEKVLGITTSKAFFSFPAAGGILAWQRKFRYRHRCDLFMYSMNQVQELFEGMPYKKIELEKISRDIFVTIFK